MSLLKGQRSIQTIILPLPPSLRPAYGNHTYRWLFAISSSFSGISHPAASITSPSSIWEIYEVAPQPIITTSSSTFHAPSRSRSLTHTEQPIFSFLPSADLTTQQLLDMQGTFIPLCVADENWRDAFLERVDRYITFPPADKGFNDQTFVLGVAEVLKVERFLGEEEYEAWVQAVGRFRG